MDLHIFLGGKRKLAFSMIELSIVILIISILIAAVVTSSSVVKKSKNKVAQSITKSSDVNSIKNLELWLETTLPESLENSNNSFDVENNDSITNWHDINPQRTPNLVASEATNMPTYVEKGINDLPTLFFDGSNDSTSGDLLKIDYQQLLSSPNFTTFVVTQAIAQNGWGCIMASRHGSDFTGYNIYKKDDNSAWELWVGDSVDWEGIINSSTINFNNPEIFTVTQDNSTSIFYRNGQLVGSNTISFTPNTSYAFQIGAGNSGIADDYFFNGYISEVIVFSSHLKDSQINQVNQYLSKKYNIDVSLI